MFCINFISLRLIDLELIGVFGYLFIVNFILFYFLLIVHTFVVFCLLIFLHFYFFFFFFSLSKHTYVSVIKQMHLKNNKKRTKNINKKIYFMLSTESVCEAVDWSFYSLALLKSKFRWYLYLLPNEKDKYSNTIWRANIIAEAK